MLAVERKVKLEYFLINISLLMDLNSSKIEEKLTLINDILRFTSTRRLQSQSCSQIKHRHKFVINPKINRANFGFEILRTFLNKIENIRSVESFFVFSIINDKNVSVILDNPGSFPDRIIRGHVTESRLYRF